MNTEDRTAGSLMGVSNELRKKYALTSMTFNLDKSTNPNFLKVFTK